MTKDSKNKAIYARSVKGGGMNIKQLIAGKHVFSLTKNKSASNGEKHGWRYKHKKRKDTDL